MLGFSIVELSIDYTLTVVFVCTFDVFSTTFVRVHFIVTLNVSSSGNFSRNVDVV